MSDTSNSADIPTGTERGSERDMAWMLEVIVVPVADIDRAKAFYSEQLGFAVDHDVVISDDARIVQLTPPPRLRLLHRDRQGRGAEDGPGSIAGLQLVVADIERAHAQLVERGVEVTDVQVLGENPADVPHPLDNVGFCFFADPDGNQWGIQQISSRAALANQPA